VTIWFFDNNSEMEVEWWNNDKWENTMLNSVDPQFFIELDKILVVALPLYKAEVI